MALSERRQQNYGGVGTIFGARTLQPNSALFGNNFAAGRRSPQDIKASRFKHMTLGKTKPTRSSIPFEISPEKPKTNEFNTLNFHCPEGPIQSLPSPPPNISRLGDVVLHLWLGGVMRSAAEI